MWISDPRGMIFRMEWAEVRDKIIHNSVVENDCWVWRNNRESGHAYASFGAYGVRLAHRMSYAAFIGDIPDGHLIHHQCELKSCVNPMHLKPLTSGEHQRLHYRSRSSYVAARNEVASRGTSQAP